MSKPCNVCQEPATVVDTEYDEYYCDRHALEYDVFNGPHQRLGDKDES
jgi:hypothetical protein